MNFRNSATNMASSIFSVDLRWRQKFQQADIRQWSGKASRIPDWSVRLTETNTDSH